MAKAHQGIQRVGPEPIGFDGVMRAVRTYVAERFPVSQAGAVLSAYACCYLLYGQGHDHQVFRWGTMVGGLTVVLLALVRRIIDDAEDLREDIRSGRVSATDGGRRRLRGLVLGAIAATALAGLLNATCSLGLLAASVAVATWFPVAMVIQNKTIIAKSRALQYIVVETCPAVLLLYSYAVWTDVAGGTIPTIGVVAIVGLFWTTFQFWGFTRKIGTDAWGPWGLTANQTRPALIFFLVLTGALSVLISHYAHLSVGYLLYGLALSGIFIALVLRWWSQLAGRDPKRVGASWAGMPFGVAVEGGVLIAVLVASL
jgi:hypothetical protein